MTWNKEGLECLTKGGLNKLYGDKNKQDCRDKIYMCNATCCNVTKNKTE